MAADASSSDAKGWEDLQTRFVADPDKPLELLRELEDAIGRLAPEELAASLRPETTKRSCNFLVL